MALSCVYRTGQRFGMKNLIDVLLGKPTDQVLRFNHDKISTFGIGKDFTLAQWQSIYRQLVAANMISVDVAGFGSFRLTDTSLPLLRGEQTIALRKDAEKLPKKKKVIIKGGSVKELVIPKDQFWQALKYKRLELAKLQNVPPYIIFHDSTLIEIHQHKPKSLAEFGKISGVGESKLQRYAEVFIELIMQFEEESVC
jgi:ATP-dependent DNA helicase RecQ